MPPFPKGPVWPLTLLVAALALPAGGGPLSAQVTPAASTVPPATSLSDARLATYAKVFAEIGRVRDEVQAQLAAPANKTPELQRELRAGLATRIAELITAGGLTDREYERITYIVSTDDERRAAFDRMLAELAAGGGEGP